MNLKTIAYIRTDFPTKFGIPRQPGLVSELRGKIVFEPEFRNKDMLRGLEEFSHLWLLWQFSANLDEAGEAKWSPTVRPPRLGGNKRLGVFATRSPFRPNPIGMSVVAIERVEADTPEGPVIYVKGADMLDKTPIYDIKPYIGYTDSISDSRGGFTDETEYKLLKVEFEEAAEKTLQQMEEKDFGKGRNSTGKANETTRVESGKNRISRDLLIKLLANDPRPHYQNDADRIYGMEFAGCEIKFRVEDGVLKVLSIERLK